MTFLIKCNNCGKITEALDYGHYPGNPDGWRSRVKDKKHIHACSMSCIPKEDMVSPF